jgi:hypothetical protein
MEHPGEQAAAEVTPVDHALDQLSTALDHLVKVVEDGGLDHYDVPGLVGFLQGFERVRNRLALVDHRAISDGERRGVPVAVTQPSMVRALTQVLRLSAGEASRRVLAAEACGDRWSMLGELLPPVRSCLAAAQRGGVVSPEQVDIIARALARVDRAGFDPADLDIAEVSLTGFAATFGAKDLRFLADRTVEVIDPDGSLPDDILHADRRHVTCGAAGTACTPARSGSPPGWGRS